MNPGRFLRTIAPLRTRQLWHRARLTARRAIWARTRARIDARYRRRAEGAAPVRWDHAGLARVAALRLERRDPDVSRNNADRVLAGRFRFLNQERELGRPVAWHRPDLLEVLLWKTHLHEFGYAIDLARAHRDSGDSAYRTGLFELIRSWDQASPIGRPGFQSVCWNARAVATRWMNWAVAGHLLGLRPEQEDARWLSHLMAVHTGFLRDNLELDLLANHLFRDAVGLTFAHAVQGGAAEGLALLEAQVAEQVLPDGCHIERSPMYHAIVLEDLLDVRTALGEDAPPWLSDAVLRMGGFLASILHRDGDLPLLGDAWRGEVAPGRLLGQVAGGGALPEPVAPEHSSGLVALRRGAVHAVLRAGPHGPDYQLGHAHADLLSFELSRGPQRLVTDTGTGAYRAGPVRSRLRSTAAHNTVALDGEELLEVWGGFRAGRRGRARVHARGVLPGFEWIWASHDGYAWLAGAPHHHRLLCVGEARVWVLDAVLGGQRHRIENRLHLYPDAPPDALAVRSLGGAIQRETVPFHERFNESRPMPALVAGGDGPLPWLGGWWLQLDGSAAPDDASLRLEGGRAVLRAPSLGTHLEWAVTEARPDAPVALRAPETTGC